MPEPMELDFSGPEPRGPRPIPITPATAVHSDIVESILSDESRNLSARDGEEARVISSIKDLTSTELKELCRIADAAVKAQTSKFSATPYLVEKFIAEIFENWACDEDHEEPEVEPFGYSMDCVVVHERSRPVATIQTEEDVAGIVHELLVFLCPAMFIIRLGFEDHRRELLGTEIQQLQWEDHDTVMNELKDLLRVALQNIDLNANMYNTSRAVEYGRLFLYESARGVDDLFEGEEYQFLPVEEMIMKYCPPGVEYDVTHLFGASPHYTG